MRIFPLLSRFNGVKNVSVCVYLTTEFSPVRLIGLTGIGLMVARNLKLNRWIFGNEIKLQAKKAM